MIAERFPADFKGLAPFLLRKNGHALAGRVLVKERPFRAA
jgi:hypothetical protein